MKLAESSYSWIVFFSRWIAGFLFLMPGWYKSFTLGPVEFARKAFVEGYADTWIPAFLLWPAGVTVALVELIGGLLLMAGFGARWVSITFGFLLIMVNYGHLLTDPFYDVTTHVMPRLLLLFIILLVPPERDRFALHNLWTQWRAKRSEG